MSKPSSRPPKPHGGIVELLLVGAGPAHLQVLQRLAQQRPAHLNVTLLTPYGHMVPSMVLAGLIAGDHTPADCQLALAPWLQRSGTKAVVGKVVQIDTTTQRVTYRHRPQDPEPAALSYDLLSLDPEAGYPSDWLDTTLPGAREQALALWPIERFVRLWDDVLALARRKPLSLAVVGATAHGCDLALALPHALANTGHTHRLSLVAGAAGVLPQQAPGVRQRMLRQLRERGITVLPQDCLGCSDGEVLLDGGGRLQCDVPLLALPPAPPDWLGSAGLSLHDNGAIAVDACWQSVSHPQVFAAGALCQSGHAEADTAHPDPTVGQTLAHNLIAAACGQPLQRHPSRSLGLRWFGGGSGHAIVQWGPLHTEGAWVWRWKTERDRAWLQQHQATGGAHTSHHGTARS